MLEIYVETILNFKCTNCPPNKSWFSISDRVISLPLHCPACGKEHTTANVKIGNNEIQDWVGDLRKQMGEIPVITLMPIKNKDESKK